MTTHIEVDGEILPAYDGVNAPRYFGPKTVSIEDMPHDFSDNTIIPSDAAPELGDIALTGVEPKLPDNIRQVIDCHGSRPASHLDRFLELQRRRYSGPESEWSNNPAK